MWAELDENTKERVLDYESTLELDDNKLKTYKTKDEYKQKKQFEKNTGNTAKFYKKWQTNLRKITGEMSLFIIPKKGGVLQKQETRKLPGCAKIRFQWNGMGKPI